jgi:hypothetical protein
MPTSVGNLKFNLTLVSAAYEQSTSLQSLLLRCDDPNATLCDFSEATYRIRAVVDFIDRSQMQLYSRGT